MLSIDPIAASQIYGRVAESSAASRSIELKPIYAGARFAQSGTDDSVDLSQNGKEFADLLARQDQNRRDAESKNVIQLTPEQRQIDQKYTQVRAQVLNFLIAQGLSVSQALPQAEKIVARMGYQRSSYSGSQNAEQESFSAELKKSQIA